MLLLTKRKWFKDFLPLLFELHSLLSNKINLRLLQWASSLLSLIDEVQCGDHSLVGVCFDQIDQPEKLYRFRFGNEQYIYSEISKMIAAKEAYMTPIADQNDPFDCNPHYMESSLSDLNKFHKRLNIRSLVSDQTIRRLGRPRTRNEMRAERKSFKVTPKNLRSLAKVNQRLVENIRSQTKVMCLTEVWDNPLMWAHYANKHAGLVYEYNVQWEMAETQIDDLPLPMKYVKKRSSVTTIDMLAWSYSAEDKKNLYKEQSDAAADAYLFEKPQFWSYEKEWRISKRDKDPVGYRSCLALKPTAIILGARCSDEMVAKVLEKFASRIEVRKCILDDKEFELKQVLLS